MKRIFYLLLTSFAAFALVSCNDEAPEDDNGGNNGSTELDHSTYPYFEEFPVECATGYTVGSDVGVTINVTKVEECNFVFQLRPGAMVRSFKMDVYPMAQLYNNLLNDWNAGNLESKESWAVNERIREYLFNEGGDGGYAFSIEDERFTNPEDFLQIDFDWMNTPYAAVSAIAIPDCDFLIAVVGSTDTDINSSNQEDLTLCHVHTGSKPLVGDPQVDIQVYTGYTKFAVEHILNPDAAGVYFFGYLKNEIDEYIDTFGETMFRDFMRTRLSAPSVEDPNNPDALVYSVNYGQGADASVMSTTCAVAVDANLTPQEGFSRRDFHLEDVPEDIEPAEAVFDIVEDRVAAGYFEFDIQFNANCQTVFWRLYSKEEKELLEKESSVNKKKEAMDLVLNGGYGMHNPNFVWDMENELPTGTGAKVRDFMHGDSEIIPGTEIYIGYTARNGAGQIIPITFSEPVNLDARKFNAPNEEIFKDTRLWLSDPTRTSFKQNITYDPSVVSLVHVQYMFPGNQPHLTVDSPWEEWMEFIFYPDVNELGYTPIINQWPTEPGGSDPWVWTVTDPSTKYTVFMCVEDFDGNISPMYFESIYTVDVQVGDDPTVNISLKGSSDHAEDWTVSYELDHDVEYFLYAIVDDAASLAPYITGITTADLKNMESSDISYEKWYTGIRNWVQECGMEAINDTAQSWKGSQTVIAACLAIGQDDEGERVYNLFILVCKDGVAMTLEEALGIE